MGALKVSKEELFAQGVVSGMSQSDAYRAAYPAAKNYKGTTVNARAHELSVKPDVAARIVELKEAAASAAVMQRQERMEVLSEIARDTRRQDKYRISAIDVLNKMAGEYVQKQSVDVTLSGDIAAMAEKVGAILDE